MQIVIYLDTSGGIPAYGYSVVYKLVSSGVYITWPTNFFSSPIVLELPDGEYEGFVYSECSPGEFTTPVHWTNQEPTTTTTSTSTTTTTSTSTSTTTSTTLVPPTTSTSTTTTSTTSTTTTTTFPPQMIINLWAMERMQTNPNNNNLPVNIGLLKMSGVPTYTPVVYNYMYSFPGWSGMYYKRGGAPPYQTTPYPCTATLSRNGAVNMRLDFTGQGNMCFRYRIVIKADGIPIYDNYPYTFFCTQGLNNGVQFNFSLTASQVSTIGVLDVELHARLNTDPST